MSPWMITFVEESILMLWFTLSTGIDSTCIPFSIVVLTREKDDDDLHRWSIAMKYTSGRSLSS
jgi:hypothetical protein